MGNCVQNFSIAETAGARPFQINGVGLTALAIHCQSVLILLQDWRQVVALRYRIRLRVLLHLFPRELRFLIVLLCIRR